MEEERKLTFKGEIEEPYSETKEDEKLERFRRAVRMNMRDYNILNFSNYKHYKSPKRPERDSNKGPFYTNTEKKLFHIKKKRNFSNKENIPQEKKTRDFITKSSKVIPSLKKLQSNEEKLIALCVNK